MSRLVLCRILRILLLALPLACPSMAPAHADPGAAGSISGRITDVVTGLPISGATIEVVDTSTPVATTDGDGRYLLANVPEGQRYLLFEHPRYAYEYYPDAPVLMLATSLTVKAGETVVGIDHAMIPLAVAHGRVVDADTGVPVAGVKVSGRGAYSANVPVHTDAEGRYELPGLNEGAYTLAVQDRSHAYLDAQSAQMSFPAGTVVDVPDIKLRKWGEFGGTVTDARTGVPIAGVWVQLYEHTGYGEWYNVIGGCYAITGPDGTYRIRGMYDWKVLPVFYDPQARFHAQSYGGGRSLLDAQAVTFKRGADLLGVDAALAHVTRETSVYLPMVAR